MKNRRRMSYSVFSKIKSSIFGNAYKVNHLKESLKNQSEDGVIDVVPTFCGLKEIRVMFMEI